MVLLKLKDGTFKSRDDIISWLRETFEVYGPGKDYIGIEQEGQKLKLKGEIYNKDHWNFKDLKPLQDIRAKRHRW